MGASSKDWHTCQIRQTPLFGIWAFSYILAPVSRRGKRRIRHFNARWPSSYRSFALSRASSSIATSQCYNAYGELLFKHQQAVALRARFWRRSPPLSANTARFAADHNHDLPIYAVSAARESRWAAMDTGNLLPVLACWLCAGASIPAVGCVERISSHQPVAGLPK